MGEARRQHVGGAMDLRIESLLTDVAALGRKEPDAPREGCAFGPPCEPIFRAQEVSKAHEGQGRSREPRGVPDFRCAHVALARHS